MNQQNQRSHMQYLPGHENILEEILVVAALAQTSLVSKGNFSALPYLDSLNSNKSSQLLIEKLLAIAIKTRFLDDKTQLLQTKARSQILIGKFFEDGKRKEDALSMRECLNKIVHYGTIHVDVQSWQAIVLDTNEPILPNEKVIQPGAHKGERVTVTIEGEYQRKKWRFEIDFFKLLDELLRVFA
jgi:hypothetical protein